MAFCGSTHSLPHFLLWAAKHSAAWGEVLTLPLSHNLLDGKRDLHTEREGGALQRLEASLRKHGNPSPWLACHHADPCRPAQKVIWWTIVTGKVIPFYSPYKRRRWNWRLHTSLIHVVDHSFTLYPDQVSVCYCGPCCIILNFIFGCKKAGLHWNNGLEALILNNKGITHVNVNKNRVPIITYNMH